MPKAIEDKKLLRVKNKESFWKGEWDIYAMYSSNQWSEIFRLLDIGIQPNIIAQYHNTRTSVMEWINTNKEKLWQQLHSGKQKEGKVNSDLS